MYRKKWQLHLKEVEEYSEDGKWRRKDQGLVERILICEGIHAEVHGWAIAKTGLFNIGLPWEKLFRARRTTRHQIDENCRNADGATVC